MPVIARFYGIIIKIFYRQAEHNPPHLHALYGEYVGVIDIQTQKMIEGDLPPKALSMVQEWTKNHEKSLMEIWTTQEFKKLPPLE